MENLSESTKGNSANTLLSAVLSIMDKADKLDEVYKSKEAELFLEFDSAKVGLPKAVAFSRWKKFVNENSR